MANLGTLMAFLGVDTSDLKRAEVDMKGFTDKTQAQMDAANNKTTSLASSFKQLAAAVGAYKVAQAAANAVLAGARYRTLGVVMDTVGRNAGFSAKQMQGFEMGLRKTGIAVTESRLNLSKMAQAQLDLTKSAQLARVAQDAAVIGNVNSSEAFSKMIHAVQTGRVAVLQTIGLNVSFGNSYRDLAKELGVATTDLSDMQKAQARLNVVLKAGERIAGAYESAMGTASKKLGSMDRPLHNLAVAFGEAFDPAFGSAIDEVTQAIKDLTVYVSQPETQESLRLTAEGLGAIASAGLWAAKIVAQAADILEDELNVIKAYAAYTEKWQAFMASLSDPQGLEKAKQEAKEAADATEKLRLEAEKLAEARKLLAFESNVTQLNTMRDVALKEKEGLKKRLDDYRDYYKDLEKQMEDHFKREEENLKNLNTLYREQTNLRKSTEALLAGLGKTPERTAEESFELSRGELAQQLESAMALTGRDQIEALEAYKQSVAALAEEFKEGFGHEEGAEIATQAIADIEAAYDSQKLAMEDLFDQTNQQIEADRMWGDVISEEMDMAAEEIDRVKGLMKELDDQILAMDTLLTLEVNDLATSEVQRVNRELNELRDRTITITTVHREIFGDKGAEGSQILDSLAVGSNYIPKTGLYELHQGEAVIPAERNTSSGGAGGVTIENLNINPQAGPNGEMDWRAIARDQIKPALDELGRS